MAKKWSRCFLCDEPGFWEMFTLEVGTVARLCDDCEDRQDEARAKARKLWKAAKESLH